MLVRDDEDVDEMPHYNILATVFEAIQVIMSTVAWKAVLIEQKSDKLCHQLTSRRAEKLKIEEQLREDSTSTYGKETIRYLWAT